MGYNQFIILYLICVLFVVIFGYVDPYSPYSSPCLIVPIIGYIGGVAVKSSNSSKTTKTDNNNSTTTTTITTTTNTTNSNKKHHHRNHGRGNHNNNNSNNIRNSNSGNNSGNNNINESDSTNLDEIDCSKCNKKHSSTQQHYSCSLQSSDASEVHHSSVSSNSLGGSTGGSPQSDIEKDINEFMNANPSHSLNKKQQQQNELKQKQLQQQQFEEQQKKQKEIEEKKKQEEQLLLQQQKQQQTINNEDGRILKNISKVYTNVNSNQPKEYYDYESYRINWRNVERYEVIKKIGRGKYSEVFSGVDTENSDEPVVIKVLKPVQKLKIKREIKILESLSGGPNIIPLWDTVKDPASKVCSLIFPFVNKTDIRELVYTLEDHEIRYYMFELLKAIDYTHSQGIIHRDIKPLNIAIDHSARKLFLIDWGLAEYYHPGKNYNVRVASRHFKPPELLVNMYDYDYSLDMWSLGCLFAGLILDRDPFFNGGDNNDQLLKIVKVLGTDDLHKFLDKFGLSLSDEQLSLIKPRQKSNWERYIPYENDDIAQPDAIDFLDKLLKYDPTQRLTAREAMKHPYFKNLNQSII